MVIIFDNENREYNLAHRAIGFSEKKTIAILSVYTVMFRLH